MSTSWLTLAACSGGQGQGGGNPAPSPSTTSTTPAPSTPETVKQTGSIVDFDTKHPIAGAAITAGGVMTMSDAQGKYTLALPKGQAFAMDVTMNGYVKVIEQQTILSADYDRGQTFLVTMDDANLMKNILQNDGTLGLLSVALLPTGGCKSVTGTKINVTSSTSSDVVKIKYFILSSPSNVATTAADGAFPSAVVYDFTPGAKLSITVDSPSCSEASYPVATDAGITFLGDVETAPAGDDTQGTTSFQRIFLQ